jgi:hypothetical protein
MFTIQTRGHSARESKIGHSGAPEIGQIIEHISFYMFFLICAISGAPDYLILFSLAKRPLSEDWHILPYGPPFFPGNPDYQGEDKTGSFQRCTTFKESVRKRRGLMVLIYRLLKSLVLGAAQTPNVDDSRSAPKPCITSPSVL